MGPTRGFSGLLWSYRLLSGLLRASRDFSGLLLTHEHITLAEEILFLIDEGRGLQLREHPGGRHLLAGLHSLAGNPSPRSEVNTGMHNAEAEYFNVIHSYQPLSLITTLNSVPATTRTLRWSLRQPTCSPDPAPGCWWWWCPAHWDCHQLAKIERALSL